jgi:hypothetical protein
MKYELKPTTLIPIFCEKYINNKSQTPHNTQKLNVIWQIYPYCKTIIIYYQQYVLQPH